MPLLLTYELTFTGSSAESSYQYKKIMSILTYTPNMNTIEVRETLIVYEKVDCIFKDTWVQDIFSHISQKHVPNINWRLVVEFGGIRRIQDSYRFCWKLVKWGLNFNDTYYNNAGIPREYHGLGIFLDFQIFSNFKNIIKLYHLNTVLVYKNSQWSLFKAILTS